MADSDYDSRDDRSDDRPRRRRDDDAPKKKGGCSIWVILLGVFGLIGLVCAGSCGGFMWWSLSLAESAKGAANSVLVKVGSGDMSGAYNGMSATYKATHTQAQFEKAMKDAKLTDFASAEYTNSSSNSSGGNSEMTLTGTATLKSGGTTPIIVKMKILPDLKTFEVEDIGGTSFVTPPFGGTPATTPSTGGTTPTTGK